MVGVVGSSSVDVPGTASRYLGGRHRRLAAGQHRRNIRLRRLLGDGHEALAE